MNYNETNDYELLFMIRENDEVAEEVLLNKYYYLIRLIINKYRRIAYIIGIDNKDLMQEALIAFYSAINSYNDLYNTSFNTYLSVCIENKLNNFIRLSNTYKERMINNAISLDDDIKEINYLIDKRSDPLLKIREREDYNTLINNIKKSLTKRSIKILDMYIKGMDYNDIAKELNLSYKNVANTLFRIREKLKRDVISF